MLRSCRGSDGGSASRSDILGLLGVSASGSSRDGRIVVRLGVSDSGSGSGSVTDSGRGLAVESGEDSWVTRHIGGADERRQRNNLTALRRYRPRRNRTRRVGSWDRALLTRGSGIGNASRRGVVGLRGARSQGGDSGRNNRNRGNGDTLSTRRDTLIVVGGLLASSGGRGLFSSGSGGDIGGSRGRLHGLTTYGGGVGTLGLMDDRTDGHGVNDSAWSVSTYNKVNEK
jgi:hypothetical protein